MTENAYFYAAQLGQCLSDRGAKVTAAESCTGGGVARAITSVPGSSRWFDCSFVTYSNEAKQRLLGVGADLLSQHGAVSQEVVCAMAEGAAAAAAAEFAVAVSGIAGPGGGSAEKPVGTVWLAWRHPGGLISECLHLPGGREDVRELAVVAALKGLLKTLNDTV
jgi:nicotinamide-nucleotide amidase